MDVVCQHEGCNNGAALPDGDMEAAKAMAEVLECMLIDAAAGPQFFCKEHHNHGLHRMRKLGLMEVPKPAPEAVVSAHPPSVEGVATPFPSGGGVSHLELIIVCQKDRILGVFDDEGQADGIKSMAEALSPEPVYIQSWVLNKPGVQVMKGESDGKEEMPEDGKGKSKARRSTKV